MLTVLPVAHAHCLSKAHGSSCTRAGLLLPQLTWRHHHARRSNYQTCSCSKGSSPDSSLDAQDSNNQERIIFLQSGDAVSLTSRRRRNEVWPELYHSKEEALQTQLQALKDNNTPYVDHGVEVMYRWADFDPWNPRAAYFGRMFDLGQFERFRRIMHTCPYATLLCHETSIMLSALEVSERTWVARVLVTGPARGGHPGDEAVYEFTMVQRLGGVHDGYWFTQSLIADGNDWAFMKGPRPGFSI